MLYTLSQLESDVTLHPCWNLGLAVLLFVYSEDGHIRRQASVIDSFYIIKLKKEEDDFNYSKK